SLEQKLVFVGVQETFLSLYGSIGIAQQKLVLKQFNPKNNCLVVQGDLKAQKQVETGLLFIKKIGGQFVVPKILFRTGILHKALEKASLKAVLRG
ncbi:Rpp14/Pop5 family protein, partial [Candidatus Micrarchaeota archaeon]|nr:Rpp14/Pop5 family protein [Candidatus Micrarchaeota archaeon]MBU1930682.1 Rpp14/Pop5 family protein [Candidatus Micrarchaeota archaeon]